MPVNAHRLATATIEAFIERPDDGLTLAFAPDMVDAEVDRIESAISGAATDAGLLVGLCRTSRSDAKRLIVTRLDHRRRLGQGQVMATTRCR